VYDAVSVCVNYEDSHYRSQKPCNSCANYTSGSDALAGFNSPPRRQVSRRSPSYCNSVLLYSRSLGLSIVMTDTKSGHMIPNDAGRWKMICHRLSPVAGRGVRRACAVTNVNRIR